MPFCKKCGFELDADAKFCPKCGTPSQLSQSDEATSSTKLQETTVSSRTVNSDEQGGYGFDLSRLPKGAEIEERYIIEEKLGRGGFGTVYKAWDKNVERFKALKVIDNIFYDDKRVIADLKHESLLLMELNSRYVVRIWDIHLKGEIKFIDMEYLEGGDLEDLLLSYPDRKVPEKSVIKLMKQISKGMSDIHNNRIIHKDLKPQNIMKTKSGDIKIMDFGISETFRSSKSRLKETSKSGTPVYMSPEHLLGKNVGKEADIWSFGVMIYELLSGRQLYTGQSQTDVLTQIKERPEYEPIEEVSKKLNRILKRCLQYEYQERFRNFDEVYEAIEYMINPPKKQEQKAKPARKLLSFKRVKEKQKKFYSKVKIESNIEKIKTPSEENKTSIRIDTKIVLIWLCLSVAAICIFLVEYVHTIILICSITSVVAGVSLIYVRRKKLKGLEIALYWLGLSFMLFILLQLIFEELDISFAMFNDDEFGPMVSAIISMASGIILLIKRKDKIEGIEIPIYWLGLSLAFFLFTGFLFEGLRLKFGGFHRDEAGRIIAGIIILITTAFLIKKRFRKITGKEVGIYWLGLGLIATVISLFVGGGSGMNTAILASLAFGIVLLFIYWKKTKSTNWIYYWLVISIILTVVLMEFFYRRGAYYTSIATLVSGLILLKIRFREINRIEIASLWAGLSIAVNFLFSYVFEQFDIEIWEFYDERSGSIVACLLSVMAIFVINKKRLRELCKTETALYVTGFALQVFIYFIIK